MFIEIEWVDTNKENSEWEVGEDSIFKRHLITANCLVLETTHRVYYYPMHTIRLISTTKE